MRSSIAIACVALLGGCSWLFGAGAPPPAPTVGVAEVIRGTVELVREGHRERVRGPARVEEGATVESGDDGRGTVRVDSGAWVLFDRDTALSPSLSAVRLESGRIWVDASGAEETTVETADGSVSAADATFAVDRVDGRTVVTCASGEVTFRSAGGADRIQQGMQVALSGNGEPEVSDVELWDDWTGGLADPAGELRPRATFLGCLTGRRLDELGRARTSLPIRSHRANVRLQGDFAVTEVQQTFFNARSDTLEGEWSIRLPEGALVQRFAVDTGSGPVDAVPSALTVGDRYALSWLDPSHNQSKLVYDGPGRLRARIFPVPPGATVTVHLTYSEWLDRDGARKTYRYPMHAEGDPPLVGEFVLEVDTSRAPAVATRAGMGATVEGSRVVLRRSDFRPRADFVLDLYDEEAPSESEVTSYIVVPDGADEADDAERFVLFDVPTANLFGDAADDPPPLELVLLLDVSGATDPEDLEIGRAVVDAVLRQLAPTDRVAIRLADVHAHAPADAPDGLVEATDANRETLLESIARVPLGGATDLGQSLRDAAELVAGRPRGAVLYLGDALPTTGDLDATALRRTLATLDAPPRYFGLAIGDGANVGLLSRLFGGQAQLVSERTAASRAVLGVLAEAARPTLRGVEVDFGEAVERVYPRPPILVRDGAHLRMIGRLVSDLPAEITVRGQRDGEDFAEIFPVRRGLVEDEGDIRRRWGQERLAEAIDEDAGREAMVDLGLRFALLSPWTSLVCTPGAAVSFSSYGWGSGARSSVAIQPVRGFDLDPVSVPWGLGGGTASAVTLTDSAGWRRRVPRAFEDIQTAPESTWASRVGVDDGASISGDGGLAQAAVTRTLRSGQRGPRACYDRRSLVRPDLRGELTVEVQVGGDGIPRSVRTLRSSVRDADLERCVTNEVQGLSFPAVGGGGTVTGEFTYTFALPERELGSRRRCSDASLRSLTTRRRLWQERLQANPGVEGGLRVWREARGACELSSFRARRTLLHMVLRSAGGIAEQVQLWRSFTGSDADYVRRWILGRVRNAYDLRIVRAGLGLDVPVDWRVFAREWRRDSSAEARLRLVRRWLAVAPDDFDLRLRLLALLEETGDIPGARRLARELRDDPLADAKVRIAVGELFLRQDDEPEARRVFSEIVERTPLDPWARRRLGDIYRAHGWADDAYREYRTLARLRPGEGAVLLLLARAAADAGRVDEALRLEQGLSEATDVGADEGVAGHARLWTTVRLARLKHDPQADEGLRAAVRRRERLAGVLRDPPAIFAALSWSHPGDAPRLLGRLPSADDEDPWEAATLGSTDAGVFAVRVQDRDDGAYGLEVRRDDEDALRDIEAELLVLTGAGTAEERIHRVPVTLTREQRVARFRLEPSGELVPVAVPR